MGRDHAVQCEICRAWHGGFSETPCDCPPVVQHLKNATLYAYQCFDAETGFEAGIWWENANRTLAEAKPDEDWLHRGQVWLLAIERHWGGV